MLVILVVEDNPTNMMLVTDVLEDEGYTVIQATDGAAGMSMALSELPDLILMDISLPLINGLEATAALKREGKTKDIPIIALTAHAMGGDRERCLAAGCDDYDTKPINNARLLGKMSTQLLSRSEEFVRRIANYRVARAATKKTSREAEALKEQLDNLQRELDRSTEELRAARHELITRTTELGAARVEITGLYTEIHSAENENQTLVTAIAKERAAYHVLEEQLQTVEAARSSATRAHERLRAHIGDLERECDSSQQTIEAQGADLEAARARVAALEQELGLHQDTERQLEEAMEQVSRLNARCAELEQALELAQRAGPTTAPNTEPRIVELSAALERAEQQLSRMRDQSPVASRKSAADRRITELGAQLAAANERVVAAEDRARQVEEQLRSTPSDVVFLRMELDRTRQHAQRLQTALANLQAAARAAVDNSYREAMYG